MVPEFENLGLSCFSLVSFLGHCKEIRCGGGRCSGEQPLGLEGCHTTCDGREPRRKLINHPRIITSCSPGAQSLSVDFQFLRSLFKGPCGLEAGLSSQEGMVQANLPERAICNYCLEHNKAWCFLKILSAQLGKLRLGLREVN